MSLNFKEGETHMRKILALLATAPLFVILVAGVPMKTVSAAQDFDVQKAIANGDHKGLADYYKAQAEKYRQKAAKHDTMAADYKKSNVHYKGMENDMATHCAKLKADAMETAAQYDEMAKAEAKLAGN